MWSHSDSLVLYPEPDFLILADDCEEYCYKMPLDVALKNETEDKKDKEEARTVTVLNPGVFGQDLSFAVVYPERNEVEQSQSNDSIL